jgi:uncharacterized protein (TIGR02246 family)
MAHHPLAQRIEEVIRTYIQACNAGDAEAIAACFCPDAVHYSPWFPKWVGSAAIGEHFATMVRERNASWTVDQLLTDVDRGAAALEWTVFNLPQPGRIVRGVDWFVFDLQTVRIREIRPYAAAPIDPDVLRQEQQDFDYAGRGYPGP